MARMAPAVSMMAEMASSRKPIQRAVLMKANHQAPLALSALTKVALKRGPAPYARIVGRPWEGYTIITAAATCSAADGLLEIVGKPCRLHAPASFQICQRMQAGPQTQKLQRAGCATQASLQSHFRCISRWRANRLGRQGGAAGGAAAAGSGSAGTRNPKTLPSDCQNRRPSPPP